MHKVGWLVSTTVTSITSTNLEGTQEEKQVVYDWNCYSCRGRLDSYSASPVSRPTPLHTGRDRNRPQQPLQLSSQVFSGLRCSSTLVLLTGRPRSPRGCNVHDSAARLQRCSSAALEVPAREMFVSVFGLCDGFARGEGHFETDVRGILYCSAYALMPRVRCRYFGAFTDSVLTAFYKSFNNQLLQFVLETCKNEQLSPDSPSPTGKSLSDLPPSVVYLMVSELEFIRNSKIMGIICSHVPKQPITGWSCEAPPAGLFLLLMEKTPEVRAWAASQVALCSRRPMSSERFLPMYSDVLRLCTNAITSPGSCNEPELFSEEPLALWRGYSVMLRFIPQGWLQSSREIQLDVRQVVIGHLSDVGPRKYSSVSEPASY